MDKALYAAGDNILLARMDDEARPHLAPHLEPLALPRGFALSTSGHQVKHCYFIQDGIASIIARSAADRSSEVGIVGREGIAPLTPILDSTHATFDIFMQVEGRGSRIAVEPLQEALKAAPSLRRLLNRYVQTFIVQAAFTSLANANHSIEPRLARWILMCHDRIDGDQIGLTHEFLALMLSVRRASITNALHDLEGRLLIWSERSMVTVRNRAGLEEFAGDSYGRAEREYRRLIGELKEPDTV
ncbi:CRP-like cAMP-binding protein [Rhizobium sp. BK275]|uniref:Crp/Fnr family transcriptional regulator n=1 Tax=unclassified Rhizobium TaxID=2613769 RepID=UPI00160CDE24|nr:MULTISPECIES: Crp/Fnr family transcriptional regulator [unclassified Rhizobium]MBB3391641.1 CRP-like cAMP-binding protein [Rhizobium sp. BK275]MBB3410052.1 CRP-like cAMP-binding protein [Rhizobium sp. BK316]